MESTSVPNIPAAGFSTVPGRGRPRKAGALSPAERAKSSRARKRAAGLKEVKCFLTPEQIAYLDAICKIHQVTIAEAISLALTAKLRGESP